MKYLLLLLLINIQCTNSQNSFPLYNSNVPNSKPVKPEEVITTSNGQEKISKVSKPALLVFLPPAEIANGTAVIICPGGGYKNISITNEGIEPAKELNKWGVTAFILKYRTPDTAYCIDPSIAPLQDAQQAMITIRKNAKRWKLDPSHIGMMGFSAGGHLASTAATHFKDVLVDNAENISARPDFLILAYPVISSDSAIWNKLSFQRLLGINASREKLKWFSNELHVNFHTPPAFIVHAKDDTSVPAKNSSLFYEALLKNNVPAELKLYEQGHHGFGMYAHEGNEYWPERLHRWMKANKWINED